MGTWEQTSGHPNLEKNALGGEDHGLVEGSGHQVATEFCLHLPSPHSSGSWWVETGSGSWPRALGQSEEGGLSHPEEHRQESRPL